MSTRKRKKFVMFPTEADEARQAWQLVFFLHFRRSES